MFMKFMLTLYTSPSPGFMVSDSLLVFIDDREDFYNSSGRYFKCAEVGSEVSISSLVWGFERCLW